MGQGSTFSITLPQAVVGEWSSTLWKSRADLPEASVMIGKTDRAEEVVCATFEALGASYKFIDSTTISTVDTKNFLSLPLLILTADALIRDEIWALISERQQASKTTLFILDPAAIALRERLYSKGFNNVFLTPILAEDLLFAYLKAQRPPAEPGPQPGRVWV